MTGLTQVKFGEKYDIPLSTIKNWECKEGMPNHRKCPEYIKKLLLRVIEADYGISTEKL